MDYHLITSAINAIQTHNQALDTTYELVLDGGRGHVYVTVITTNQTFVLR